MRPTLTDDAQICTVCDEPYNESLHDADTERLLIIGTCECKEETQARCGHCHSVGDCEPECAKQQADGLADYERDSPVGEVVVWCRSQNTAMDSSSIETTITAVNDVASFQNNSDQNPNPFVLSPWQRRNRGPRRRFLTG
jgi:hypothetical protein